MDPVLIEAGPNKAVIFDGRTDGAASKMSFDDDEDSFFDHTLDEVRVGVFVSILRLLDRFGT